MTENYEGEAHDLRAKKKERRGTYQRVATPSPTKNAIRIPEVEEVQLPLAEVQRAAMQIREWGLESPISSPGEDANYGEFEYAEALWSAAQALIARDVFARAEQERKRLDPPYSDLLPHEAEAENQKHIELSRDLVRADAQAKRDLRKYQEAVINRENRLLLGELVGNRRKRMKKTQADFAEEANVSLSTLKTIENSDHPTRGLSSKSVSGVEKALGWLPGSIESILNGGKPIEDGRVVVSQLGHIDDEWDSDGLLTSGVYQDVLVGDVQLPLGNQSQDDSATTAKALYVDDEVWRLINQIQFHEGRNVNDVLEDALSLYWNLRGPRKDAT